MKKNILTVTVNPALDLTVDLATALQAGGIAYARPGLRLPPKVERLSQLRMRCSTNFTGCVLSAGGKGINVARALCALGVPARAAGVAAGETGEVLRKLLRREKISTDFLSVAGTTRVNVTILGKRTHQRILEEGPKLSSDELRQFEQKFVRALRGARLVVLSGRNANGAPADWYGRLVKLAARHNVPAAVDTSGAALGAAISAKPFLIKPNREEAGAVLGERLNSVLSLKKAARHFHRRGVAVVLISLGSQGAFASDSKDVWVAAPPQARAVNDVGSGDVFLAGFLCAQQAHKSFPESLRYAVACGTVNASKENSTPGLIAAGDVPRLAQKVTLKNLGTLS